MNKAMLMTHSVCHRWAGAGLLLAVVIAWSAAGDTVILKTGGEFHGKIKAAEEDPLYLELGKGEIAFYQEEIAEIKFDDMTFAGDIRDRLKPPKPADGSKEPTSKEELEKRIQWFIQKLDEVNDKEEEYSYFNPERKNLVLRLGALGTDAVAILEKAFAEADVLTQPYILAALLEADPVKGAKLVKGAVREHPDPDVRHAAVTLLGDYIPKASTEELIRASQDTQGHIREAAAVGLGRTGTRGAIDALVRLLDDELPNVQDASMTSLAKITGKTFATPEQWQEWAAAQ